MKKSVWLFALSGVVCLAFIFFLKSFYFDNNKEVLTSNLNSYSSEDPNECQEIKGIKEKGYVSVGIKVDMPKFSYLNPETNREEGFEPDLARVIAAKILGDETAIKFRPVTPKTRGPLLDNSELDFVIGTFTITEKRKQSYNFTVPYYVDYISFLVNKNSNFKSINDFAGKTIGVSQSTPTKACLQKKAKELNIDFNFAEYTSYHELKTALAIGRIDVFSADKSILLGYKDDSNIILNDSICKQEYGMACKLENKNLCEYLSKIINEIKTDGTLRNLLNKWGLESEYC